MNLSRKVLTVLPIYEALHASHACNQKFESPFKLHLRDNPTHSFDRDKIEVLDSSPYNVDLETKESLYISYLKPSLNTDTKSRPLLLF